MAYFDFKLEVVERVTVSDPDIAEIISSEIKNGEITTGNEIYERVNDLGGGLVSTHTLEETETYLSPENRDGQATIYITDEEVYETLWKNGK